jgi:kynureninase
MLKLPDSNPAQQIVSALRAAAITTDHRSQTLRLSPGILTSETGVTRLHKALEMLLH